MALDMQPGAELGHTGVDASASSPVAPGDDASTASPAVCAAYERAMRVATLLVGDQALAADVVAGAVTSVRADQRRRALRLAPGPELLRPLVLRAQEIDDAITHGEPTAPPPLVRTSDADDDDPFHAISHRDLRWALLALPMRDRAIVVLGALTELDDADLQRVLVLDGGEVAPAAQAARALLLDTVQVDATPEQLDAAIGRAADDLTVTVEPDAVAELLRHERSWRERLGRPKLTRWAILAALLVGALVWLTTRDPRPPKVVVTPPPSNLGRPTSTASTPARSSVPTSAAPASAVGLRTVGGTVLTATTATTAATTTAPTAATAATTVETVDAATEEFATDTTAARSAATAPATTAIETPPTAAPDTVAATVPATTAAPPATTTATTAAPPATTAAPPATTPAPPATTAAPPATTAAPTTTVAPTRLAISSTTCRRTWFDVTFTVSGVTSPTNPSVSLATPWGTFSAAATGQGATATWTVRATAPAWFPGPGPYGLTANAGGQQATASMTCG